MSIVRLAATLLALVLAGPIAAVQAADPVVIAIPDVVPVRGFPNMMSDWVSSRYWPLLFDALTEVGEDGEILPALAVSWRASDPLTWEFELRPDVKFSNGEPLDSAAVASTLDYLQTEEAIAFPIYHVVRNIARVEPISELRVRIRTTRPDGVLPARLRSIRILPPRYFGQVGRVQFAEAPHGTGPFMAKRLARTRSVFLPNPHAWRPPKWSEVDFLPVRDSIARAQSVISGAVDIAFDTGPEIADAVLESGARLVPHDIGSVDAIPFVTTMDTPLRDKRVRLALNYAVDRQQLIAVFVHGATSPATQFAPHGAFGYMPGLPEAYHYDPAKAKRLLAEAGYPNGFDTALELWADGTNQGAMYQQVTSNLRAVGVRVRIVQVPVLQWQAEGLYGGKWEAPMFNFPYIALPSFDALDALATHSCLWSKPFNCDREIADRILEAQETFDTLARLERTRAVLDAFRADPPAILLFPSIHFDLVGKRMQPFTAPFGFIRYQELAKSAP